MLSPLLGHKVQTLRTLTLHCLRFPNALLQEQFAFLVVRQSAEQLDR